MCACTVVAPGGQSFEANPPFSGKTGLHARRSSRNRSCRTTEDRARIQMFLSVAGHLDSVQEGGNSATWWAFLDMVSNLAWRPGYPLGTPVILTSSSSARNSGVGSMQRVRNVSRNPSQISDLKRWLTLGGATDKRPGRFR